MILVRKIHQLRGYAALLQGVEQLDAMAQGNSQIELSVYHQRWGREVTGGGVRRVLREFPGLVPEIEEALGFGTVVRTHLGEQVVPNRRFFYGIR